MVVLIIVFIELLTKVDVLDQEVAPDKVLAEDARIQAKEKAKEKAKGIAIEIVRKIARINLDDEL